MDDWRPNSYIEKIAIAQVFTLYEDTASSIENMFDYMVENRLNEIIKEISELELMTAHPYVKFQKARIMRLFLTKDNIVDKDNIKNY